MSPTRGLDHIVLRVRDLETSLAFYRTLLGLEIEGLDAWRADEKPFVSARIGDSLIDLVPDPTYQPEHASAGGLVHFCITVDDFAALLADLRAAAVPFLHDEPMPRGGARGIGLSVYVLDPDGYTVEIKAH
jgi:glyoxylase I family protein